MTGKKFKCPACEKGKLSFYYHSKFTEIYCQNKGCWKAFRTTHHSDPEYGKSLVEITKRNVFA